MRITLKRLHYYIGDFILYNVPAKISHCFGKSGTRVQYADPKMACPSLIRHAIFGSAYCSTFKIYFIGAAQCALYVTHIPTYEINSRGKSVANWVEGIIWTLLAFRSRLRNLEYLLVNYVHFHQKFFPRRPLYKVIQSNLGGADVGSPNSKEIDTLILCQKHNKMCLLLRNI